MLKRITAHPTFKSLVWFAVERVLQVLLGIVVSGLMARHLGVALFGQWQYALSVVMIAMSMTWLCGAEVLVPRLATADASEADRILGTAFVVRLANAGVVTALLLALVPWLTADGQGRLLLVGLGTMVLVREPAMVAFAWLQSRTQVQGALLVNMVVLVLKVAVIAALVRVSAPPLLFALAWAGESIVGGVALLVLTIRRYGQHWRYARPLVGPLVRSGLVVWIGLVATYVFFRIDRLVLSRVLDAQAYGAYAAAAQMNDNWIAVGTMMAQTFSPIFVYRAATVRDLRRNLRRLVGLSLGLSVVGFLVLYLAAPLLIPLVFGDKYLASVAWFRGLLGLALVFNVESMLNTVLLKHGASRWFAGKWVAGLAVAGVACPVLAVRLGAAGAIVALYLGAATILAVTVGWLAASGALRPEVGTDPA